ncbi:MAG: Gfo/Idh/MocA family oxidoreductase [Chloroflexi bacterium]|nr:Gfo/Idh/MocA family oxidoreductase [Chloroflexota bacterium]
MRSGPGVALLGYGAIAELHAPALAAAGAKLRVVAGPDRSQLESFASRLGVEEMTVDAEAAIAADGVDVVVVASPSPLHVAQARSALRAGRQVLVEVPLAMSLGDGEELVGLAASRGLLLGVCHTLRFWEPLMRARAATAATPDSPALVVARCLQRRHENVGWTGRARSWTDDLLWHHGGHVIDLVLTLLDSPVAEVRAVAGRSLDRSGAPMDYAISIRTLVGGIGSIALSYDSLVDAADYTIVYPEETLVIDGARVRTSGGLLYDGDSREAEAQAIAAQDAAFLAAVRGGPTFAAEASTLLPTLRVQEAVARLAAEMR